MSRGDFELNNHRMHNKLFVADGAMALFGGRNVADEYYMGSADANFIDMDLLATGAVVADLSAVFDRYWNSAQAWPLERVRPVAHGGPARAEARHSFDTAVQHAPLPKAGYARDPLGRGPVGEQLAAAGLNGPLDGLAWAEARVHADPPEKATMATPRQQPTEAMAGLMRAMATARRYVAIVSPYFVPNEQALVNMREARSYGIRLIVVTNSLASTDEPLVHASYALRRPELLKMGVELHEISPALIRSTEHYGVFGRSVPRLHAKVAIVDGLRVLVGSVNLDARSAIGNTEMGVVIESPPLAAELQRLMQSPSTPAAGHSAPNVAMYRVTLAEDGQTLQWRNQGADGSKHLTTDEPGSSAWLRFKLWLQSLVVPERLL
jgi:putative cardiolipin synthase